MAREHQAIDVFPHTDKTIPQAKAPAKPVEPKPAKKKLVEPPQEPPLPTVPPDVVDQRVHKNVSGEMLVSELVAKVQFPLDTVLDSLERLVFLKKVKVFRRLPTSPLLVISTAIA